MQSKGEIVMLERYKDAYVILMKGIAEACDAAHDVRLEDMALAGPLKNIRIYEELDETINYMIRRLRRAQMEAEDSLAGPPPLDFEI